MKDDEQQARLEQVGEQIMHHLAPEDPLERKKLIGAIDLGQRIAEFLQSEIADEDTYVDTGSDGHSYDCEVKMNGREYSVNVSAGDTDEEVEQFWEEHRQAASQWDLLCPRVLEALRAGPDQALADEFEALARQPQ